MNSSQGQLATFVRSALDEGHLALKKLQENSAAIEKISEASQRLAKALGNQHKVYSFGNGGSMCDAMHFAEELSGRFRKNRPPLAALALSDPAHLSCVANDFGYNEVFGRYLQAFAQPGDIALGISTSGTSKNVINGLKAAKAKGAFTIALTGKEHCEIADLVDLCIATPAGTYSDRVQELHIKVIHIMIELCERQLFPQLYT